MFSCVPTRMCTHELWARMNKCIHAQFQARTHTHTHKRIARTHARARTHALTHSRSRTRTHTRTHTHTRTNTHTHTHTHTPITIVTAVQLAELRLPPTITETDMIQLRGLVRTAGQDRVRSLRPCAASHVNRPRCRVLQSPGRVRPSWSQPVQTAEFHHGPFVR